MNEQKEEYGDEKLQQIIQSSRDISSGALIEKSIGAIILYIGDVPQNDDMTMVLLSRKAF